MLFGLTMRLVARLEPRLVPHRGIALREIGSGIWRAERWIEFGRRIRLPLAMVVVQGPDGGLLLYAPVAVDDGLGAALRGLGEVRWIVAPNRSHTAFLDACAARFPHASVHRGVAPPDIDAWLACREVAVHDRFTEVCAYHRASKTLLLCDLAFNLNTGPPALRWLMRLNDAWARFGPTRVQRWVLFRNRAAIGDFYRWAMARPFVQVSCAHGALLRHDARETFYQAFHRFAA